MKSKVRMKKKHGKNKVFFAVIFTLCFQLLLPPVSLLAVGEAVAVTGYAKSVSGSVEAGDDFTLTVTLKNNSSSSLDGAKISIDDDSSFYSEDSDGLTKTISTTWASGGTATVEFHLTYDGGSRKTITIKAVNSGGDSLTVSNDTYTVSVDSTSDETDSTSTSEPVLNIVSNTALTGTAGEKLTVSLSIKNTGDYTAKNIRIMPDLTDDIPFRLDSSSSDSTISSLDSDEKESVHYSFTILPYAEEKMYELKFYFRYFNDDGDYFGDSSDTIYDSVYVTVSNNNTVPRITLGEIQYSHPVEGHPNVLKAELKIINSGSLPAKNAKITLQGLKDDGICLYKGSNLQSIDSISGNSQSEAVFWLVPSSKIAKGNYALTAKIEYEDQNSQDYSGEHQFFVPVTYGGEGNSVPKIILSSYNCSPSIVKAGQKFTLKLSFLNTSKDKGISNIKVYFTVPDGGEDSSGSVFTPVNSSNTFFIDEIAPKGSIDKMLQFYTIPDAKPKTYSLTANFEYQDEIGTEYKATEIIGVPVNQQISLETSELQLPTEAYVGQPVSVSMDFYNTGKAKISNLMLKLEGEFDTQNSAYYVGNFDTGSSDSFEGSVIPTAMGLQKGALVITFDEPSGEHMEVRKDFTLNVTEMAQPEMIPGSEPEDTGTSGLRSKLLLWGGIALAVLILIISITIILKKGLIKKIINRKKGQTLDE